MIPVLTGAEARAFDGRLISRGVPGVVLMENAGRGATEVILREAKEGGLPSSGLRVVVLAGPGSNGGDGFVVARHLLSRGMAVDVLLLGDAGRLVGDAKAMAVAFRAVGGVVTTVTGGVDVGARVAGAHVIVDALFGTGLDRPLEGAAAEVVATINGVGAASTLTVALDMPSGVHADTGATLGVAVQARATATFAFPKRGLLTPAGAARAGRLHVVDLGVPSALAPEVLREAFLVEPADVSGRITPRPVNAHKGTTGHVAVFAGSPGRAGAALLSGRAALRGGAGLVTLASRARALQVLGVTPELMTATLDDGAVAESVDAILDGKSSVVLGPGFGTDEGARALAARVLQAFEGPVVVDADALTLFADRHDAFTSARGSLVLTPHPGEAGRLLGISARDVEAHRYGAVRKLADITGAVVVLKGAHTLVSAPGGPIAVAGPSTAALATAGSGDVLAGILAAQLGGLPPFEAAWVAVHLHGAAACLWASQHGDRGLLASEVADHVPAALARLRRG